MINFDIYVNENKTEHNKNWPYIRGSGSWKTNLLLSEFNKKSTRMNDSKNQKINFYLIKEKVWE